MALVMGLRWIGPVLVAAGCATPDPDGGGTTSGTGSGDPTSTGAATTAMDEGTFAETTPAETTVAESSQGDTTIGSASETTTTSPGACDDSTSDLEVEGGESSGSVEDSGGGMGGDIPIGASVFTVRQGTFDTGTLVEIQGLVVTSPIATLDLGEHVFLQAEVGGDYSGLVVITSGDTSELAIGTRVRVVGRVAQQDDLVRIVIGGGVEAIVAEGVAAVPEPVVLQLADLDDPKIDPLAFDAALVRVELPEVTNDAACPGEFALAADVRVDDLFLGEDAPSPAAGTSYTAILGPLRSTATGYEIAPRSLDDLIE
jgi:hypothetical protein